MNTVISNNLSLKYQRFRASGTKDIGIRKFGFVAKTQFLWRVCLYPINVKTAEPVGSKFYVETHETQGKVYGCLEFDCRILKIHEK